MDCSHAERGAPGSPAVFCCGPHLACCRTVSRPKLQTTSMPDDTHDACEQLQLDDARLRLETGLTQYGGGRGVFTTVAFQPGDVVMRETPFHVGPDGVAVRSDARARTRPM